MSLSIRLHSIRSLNESSEASSSDEYYVLVTVASLRPPIQALPIPAAPNFRVFAYGVFEDMDDDDDSPVIVPGPPFWGMDGSPADIVDPSDVAIVVSLMEFDNGGPAQYSELVNARTALSLVASAGAPGPAERAARLAADISNVLNAVDVPIPFSFDDDHIATLQMVLDQSDLIQSGTKDRVMVFEGDGTTVELVLSISDSLAPPQPNWRFCSKCNALFFDGFPEKGVCSAGGSHGAAGFNFLLPHDTDGDQANWRFCHKCNVMFFDGFPEKGVCSAGGVHEAAGFNFVLQHDVDGPGQDSWRFCRKCNAMFFDGFPSKGVCPAPGPSTHEASGFNFVLPHDVPGDQANWRFCHKCSAMFFDGFPAKGACSAGGGHEASGFNFVLPHDVPGDQANWRFCHKCSAMFYDGFPEKGVCPARGPSTHEAAGFNFRLDHL